jgi:hypothetical protein
MLSFSVEMLFELVLTSVHITQLTNSLEVFAELIPESQPSHKTSALAIESTTNRYIDIFFNQVVKRQKLQRGTLNIGTMHFNTPQSRITKYMRLITKQQNKTNTM